MLRGKGAWPIGGMAAGAGAGDALKEGLGFTASVMGSHRKVLPPGLECEYVV